MFPRFRISLLAAIVLTALALPSAAAAHTPGDNDPDVIEIRHYPLTMAKVDKFVAATQALKKLADANPELKKRMDADNDDKDESITKKAADMDLHFPEAAAVVLTKGLTTREYIVVAMALINDVMIVGMKKQGDIKEYPPNTITPENAAFVEQNYDKIQQALSAAAPDQTQQ